MPIKSIRNQIALFGEFNFPADSETTVELLNTFSAEGFMPQTIQAMDTVTGLMVQRLNLVTNGEAEIISIIFSPDRVDITTAMPNDNDLAPYIEAAAEYMSRLVDRAPKYMRLGLVRDFSFVKSDDEADVDLRARLLPFSPVDSFDWTARWIESKDTENGKYNFQIEAARQLGMGMVVGNRIESIDGIKLNYDVSTSPENMSKRFNSENVLAELVKMAKVMGDDPLAFLGR